LGDALSGLDPKYQEYIKSFVQYVLDYNKWRKNFLLGMWMEEPSFSGWNKSIWFPSLVYEYFPLISRNTDFDISRDDNKNKILLIVHATPAWKNSEWKPNAHLCCDMVQISSKWTKIAHYAAPVKKLTAEEIQKVVVDHAADIFIPEKQVA
jgi:hypothetical protein